MFGARLVVRMIKGFAVSWQGVLLVLLALAFCAQVFWAADRRSHSVSDTLYGIFPFVVPCLMLLNWVTSKTCGGV